ncbi:alpha/beta hydrolase [Corynebacterium propinquum]|uniref:alpha/beta hydrolase n=1 Tax=Corynebacterium propinquum TaxID=43769 RepID=UPI00191E8760|nr:alpha/beta hydrolase [Corynebacterium propinquum]MDK4291430.1 alpha/beta hydrolase [Corynebacterium propinquum]QQU86998.1 alpha/beta hydrolase [Corynebacterium propinquum]
MNNSWVTDSVLGTPFQQLTFDFGTEPTEHTTAYATLVRYTGSSGADSLADDWAARPAILWIHGLTDYFFHKHVAEYFHHQGFAFYALDLRKCGRSLRDGQTAHHCLDIAEYYEELDAAAELITAAHEQAPHKRIIPLAHSTGGLIAPLWLDYLRREKPQLHAHCAALVLNSPWMELPVSDFLAKIARPVLAGVGKIFPGIPFPGGVMDVYGRSLHQDYDGEWDIDLRFKPLGGFNKHMGWIRAIITAQGRIHRDEINAGVPVLTLSSTQSAVGTSTMDKAQQADIILDVEHMWKWTPYLAPDVTLAPLEGAMHDVFLSRLAVRENACETTFTWLERNGVITH